MTVENRMVHNECKFLGLRRESYVEEKREVRSETVKGCHKVFDLAGRRGFAGFKVVLNA
jgi:hypothetical protein